MVACVACTYIYLSIKQCQTIKVTRNITTHIILIRFLFLLHLLLKNSNFKLFSAHLFLNDRLINFVFLF